MEKLVPKMGMEKVEAVAMEKTARRLAQEYD